MTIEKFILASVIMIGGMYLFFWVFEKIVNRYFDGHPEGAGICLIGGIMVLGFFASVGAPVLIVLLFFGILWCGVKLLEWIGIIS